MMRRRTSNSRKTIAASTRIPLAKVAMFAPLAGSPKKLPPARLAYDSTSSTKLLTSAEAAAK